MSDTEPFRLSPGDHAPDFTLPDQNGAPVALSEVNTARVVLYFYPAALTPACTTQACDFRDNLGRLQSAGLSVLGVSKDDVPTLARFAEHDHLTFPLLSDAALNVHRAYGAWGEKKLYGKVVTGVLRSTFVIAPGGTVEQALYNVKATGHVDRILKLVGA
jgi:thioredoxin-dependent peroxiredoxin